MGENDPLFSSMKLSRVRHDHAAGSNDSKFDVRVLNDFLSEGRHST